MMMPRRMTLDSEGQLRQEPTGDIASLRYDHRSVGTMKLPANEEIVLEAIRDRKVGGLVVRDDLEKNKAAENMRQEIISKTGIDIADVGDL